MIKEYAVLVEETLGDLVNTVNKQIKLGWQPLAAPFVVTYPQGIRLRNGSIVQIVVCQAMTK